MYCSLQLGASVPFQYQVYWENLSKKKPPLLTAAEAKKELRLRPSLIWINEEENHPQIRRLPSRRRSRTNFSEAQCALLEMTFSHTHYPDHQMKREIAFRLGIASDRVTVWFQNRRSKWRRSNYAAGGWRCPTPKQWPAESRFHANAFYELNGDSEPFFSPENGKTRECHQFNSHNQRCEMDSYDQSELRTPSTCPDSVELATPELFNCWTESIGRVQEQRVNITTELL
uniref:Homeobox domain-containing protein n=1 Tax=Globodera rostochiensis TaxID=31243 RepID=A0A914H8F6_GLORO